jgi:hypothetical protein
MTSQTFARQKINAKEEMQIISVKCIESSLQPLSFPVIHWAHVFVISLCSLSWIEQGMDVAS